MGDDYRKRLKEAGGSDQFMLTTCKQEGEGERDRKERRQRGLYAKRTTNWKSDGSSEENAVSVAPRNEMWYIGLHRGAAGDITGNARSILASKKIMVNSAAAFFAAAIFVVAVSGASGPSVSKISVSLCGKIHREVSDSFGLLDVERVPLSTETFYLRHDPKGCPSGAREGVIVLGDSAEPAYKILQREYWDRKANATRPHAQTQGARSPTRPSLEGQIRALAARGATVMVTGDAAVSQQTGAAPPELLDVSTIEELPQSDRSGIEDSRDGRRGKTREETESQNIATITHRRLLVVIVDFAGHSHVECTTSDIKKILWEGVEGKHGESVFSLMRKFLHGAVSFAKLSSGEDQKVVFGPITINENPYNVFIYFIYLFLFYLFVSFSVFYFILFYLFLVIFIYYKFIFII